MKKVLFVSHGFACFMSDILFHGLMKLGYDVYEYPQGMHYYGGDSIFGGKKNLGKDTFLNFCYFNFQKSSMTDKEIIEQDYDYIIITSWRPEQPWILENIYKRFKGKVPIAFVDGEDDLHIRQDEFYNDVYFKRERKLGTYENKNIKPITFGIIDRKEYEVPCNRKYLLSFIASGHNIDGLRCQMFRNLAQNWNKEKMFYLDVERAKDKMLLYKKYRQILLQSQIGISIAGEGYDTYRYWEIPYFKSLLMADIADIYMPDNNFTDMENAVFFKNINEFNEKLGYLQNHPNDIEKIAEAGHKFLLGNHTSLHRAVYVINALEEIK